MEEDSFQDGFGAYCSLTRIYSEIVKLDIAYDEQKKTDDTPLSEEADDLQIDLFNDGSLATLRHHIHMARFVLVTRFIQQMIISGEDATKEITPLMAGELDQFQKNIVDMAEKLKEDLTELEQAKYTVSDNHKHRIEKLGVILPGFITSPPEKRRQYIEIASEAYDVRKTMPPNWQ